ncbi:hypothetical protein [Streptomyces sp. NPDC020298]|uniref:hypothetical protein n=1 Tax=unclassified Streptomyces TaxID=2593676 RepID=UPI0033CF9565
MRDVGQLVEVLGQGVAVTVCPAWSDKVRHSIADGVRLPADLEGEHGYARNGNEDCEE